MKKVGRSESPQLNTENRENSVEMNSDYASLDTNQLNGTVDYATLASTQGSSPPDHPRSDSTYEDVSDNYLVPVSYAT